jgi:hypothetical protein
MSLEDIVKSNIGHDEKEKIVYAKLKRNAERWFKTLGKGSSRKVFLLEEDSWVLKLAINKKGIAQNEFEYQLSNDWYYEELFTKIQYGADDMSFLISQYAPKITTSDFKTYFNMYFQDFVKNFENNSSFEDFLSPFYLINDNIEQLSKLRSFVDSYGVPEGDLVRLSSWGKTKEGELVIIDYGLSRDIYNKHYQYKS